MEIRINKEIKDYHESLFMGLSMRQFMCSLGAVGAAVIKKYKVTSREL